MTDKHSIAEHHRQAAEHHRADNVEKAAHHAHVAHGHHAHGHHAHATHHAAESGKLHAEHHGAHGEAADEAAE